MSLTINTHPSEVITNAPEFNVTTSLVEGASYQNLRVRATIYLGGYTEAVAILEQPKGLDDWDFAKILKSFIGRCNEAVGGATGYKGATMGSNLVTGWTNYASGWDTFTTSGNQITSAIETDYSGAIARSNDLGAVSIGDLYVAFLEHNFSDGGNYDIFIRWCGLGVSAVQADNKYAGLSGGKLIANHIYFGLFHEADTASEMEFIADIDDTAQMSGTIEVHKITDFKNNPGVYFKVVFEEVYENASDVTTVGGSTKADTLLYIPIKLRPGELLSDYLISTTGKKALTRAEDGDALYKFGIDMELRYLFASVAPFIKVNIITDAGATAISLDNNGWGLILLNDSIASIDAQDETVQFQIISTQNGGTEIYTGADFTINCDLINYKNAKALNFIGDLGEETIIFRGMLTEKGYSEKGFYKDNDRIRKVISSYRSGRMKLRTLYESEALRRLIFELILTDFDVWMFDANFTEGYKEVTVLDNDITISDMDEILETEIEVEYYE